MNYDYGKMLGQACEIHGARVINASRSKLQQAIAEEAVQGYVGKSSGTARTLGRSLIVSNVELTKQFIGELDRLIATGGDDVPADAAENLTSWFPGALEHMAFVLEKTVKQYLGDFDGMNRMIRARIMAQWNEARIELDQEFGLMLRKHRSIQQSVKKSTASGINPHPVSLRGINTQVGPIHFEDFSGKQFERLLLGFAIRSGWKDAEWIGEAGADGGRDIWCDNTGRAILCANFKRPTFRKAQSDLGKITSLGVKVNTAMIVFGGIASADLRKKIKAAAKKLGINDCSVWGHSELEENIRAVGPDLLRRFCLGGAFPEVLEEMRALADPGDKVKLTETSIPASPASDFDPEQMSDNAKKLLFRMTESEDGQVLRVETQDGYSLTINDCEFVPDTRERRITAMWERVLRELCDAGLIEAVGTSGELFAVTDAGYQAIDECGLIP